MNAEEITKFSAYMLGVWPNLQTTDATPLVLHDMLHDVAFDLAIDALRSLATEHPDFAPNPAVMRARAIELRDGPTPTWSECWEEIVEQQKRCGWIGFPRFADPLTYVVVRKLGGWRHTCETFTSLTEVADRAHVRQMYEETARTARLSDLADTRARIREAQRDAAGGMLDPRWRAGILAELTQQWALEDSGPGLRELGS